MHLLTAVAVWTASLTGIAALVRAASGPPPLQKTTTQMKFDHPSRRCGVAWSDSLSWAELPADVGEVIRMSRNPRRADDADGVKPCRRSGYSLAASARGAEAKAVHTS